MITPETVVVAVEHQMAADLDGETVILDMEAGVYYGLDEVGASVWALIATPHTLAEICAQLMSEYDVAADQCRHDVVVLLEQLAAKGLVEVRDASAA